MVCLGSNIGNRHGFLNAMRAALAPVFSGGMRCSRVMETEPVGVDNCQNWYLNQIVEGICSLQPEEFLDRCELIERGLGRTGKGLGESRTADMDILLFGERIINTSRLTVPHPRIGERRFCLEGLRDIDPNRMVTADLTVEELLRQMPPEVAGQVVRTPIGDSGAAADSCVKAWQHA